MTELLNTPAQADVDELDFIARLLPCYVDRRAAETAAWLAGEDPQRSWLASLLHTEVTHPGACYRTRLLRAALIGLPVAAGADLSYAVGRFDHRGEWNLLPLGPVWTVLALLAGAGLLMLTVLGWHALWHRAEAPYIHNVVLTDEDIAELHPAGDAR